MGMFKRLAQAFGLSKQEVRVLVVGLDFSGKTTLISHIKPRKAAVQEITPTVGFTVEEFSKNNLNFTVFDMSGQTRYRSLWESYYGDAEAIIFVIDSTDRLRMRLVKDELDVLLQNEEIASKSLPILFFANKVDLPGSLTPVQCMQTLELERITEHPWHITSSNAVAGIGIDEGVDWLCEHVTSASGK